MKLLAVIIAFFSLTPLFSQLTFEMLSSTPEIGDFNSGMDGFISAGDVDNDGDIDLFSRGEGVGNVYGALYLNDGDGYFTFSMTFPDAENAITKLIDVDNDNDLDFVLVTDSVGNLYKNDGAGNFSLYGSPFAQLSSGKIDTTDLENDGDMDIVICGKYYTKLYLNDGVGNFTEDLGNPLPGTIRRGICFLDFDNDGFDDLIISGHDYYGSGLESTKYFHNDGVGQLVEQTIPLPPPSVTSNIEAGDFNGDGLVDLVINGGTNIGSSTYFGDIYLNNGSGFILFSTDIIDVIDGTIQLADIENDGDTDILVTGHKGGIDSTALHLNDGFGNFTVATSLNLDNSSNVNNAVIFDLESDGDLDIALVGNGVYNNRLLYRQFTCPNDINNNISVSGATMTADTNGLGATYWWVDCDFFFDYIPGAINQSYTPSINGNYAVIITYLGCTDTSLCQEISNIGISENSPTVEIYPNPSNGIVNLVSSTNMNSLKLFSIQGELIFETNPNTNKFQPDMKLNEGIYVLLTTFQDGSTTQSRIVIQ